MNYYWVTITHTVNNFKKPRNIGVRVCSTNEADALVTAIKWFDALPDSHRQIKDVIGIKAKLMKG